MDERHEELMVTIRCLAYNHEPYIRQCLDGFVMQKTNFRFEAIVHDDASTDGTAAIIKEYAEKYPDIIKPIFETENQYSKRDGSISRIMDEYTHGKYVAFCEGDDYWIDPLKLQKQVDFLEENNDYGMVHTLANALRENGYISPITKRNSSIENLLFSNSIPTLTVCFRRELFIKYKREICPELYKWKMGDYPIWLWFAINSKIYCIEQTTAIYRIQSESASHSKDVNKLISFVKDTYNIRIFYIRKYFVNNKRRLEKKALSIKKWTILNIYLSHSYNKLGFDYYLNNLNCFELKYLIYGFLKCISKGLRNKVIK